MLISKCLKLSYLVFLFSLHPITYDSFLPFFLSLLLCLSIYLTLSVSVYLSVYLYLCICSSDPFVIFRK